MFWMQEIRNSMHVLKIVVGQYLPAILEHAIHKEGKKA